MKINIQGNLYSATEEEHARNQAAKIRNYWHSKGRTDIYAEAVHTRMGWRVASNVGALSAIKK